MPDLLLEIGCEEIPARMIAEGAGALWSGVRTLLEQLKLSPPTGNPADYGRVFYTPRRLAVLFPDVSERQSDTTESVVGPAAKIAFKDGQPTPAAVAFAKKAGLEIPQLKTVSTGKGDYLAADVLRKGRSAVDLLTEMIPSEIFGIAWPKTMYWEQKNDRFVRPIRWIVALLGDKVLPMTAFGIRAQNATRGHRELANQSIVVREATDYLDALRRGKVVGEYDDRQEQILKSMQVAVESISGARPRPDGDLLDTVVNLTEWPSAILGNFDREFLELPEEVLVTVMRDHQKYFAVEDANGKLLPHFLAVLNTDGDADGIIRHGHERVLLSRFNDARFFWQTDQKHPLRERTAWLKHVTFQKDLGSYYEKMQRMLKLSSWLCELLIAKGANVRKGIVHKAVCLAKTDLTTELVKEFTELQGIVGGLYAGVQELDDEMPDANRQLIARCIYDQYKPESMEDSLPRDPEGDVVSIVDKADNVAGMFALGLQPTGSKDPFALRRQANAIVRIIAEHRSHISVNELMLDAYKAFDRSPARAKFLDILVYLLHIQRFFRERLEFYLRDVLGFRYDVVNAALAAGSDDIVDAIARAEAVADVLQLPEFQAIAAACKRMRNIVRQAEEKRVRIAETYDYSLESAEEPKLLDAKAHLMSAHIEKDRAARDYKSALIMLSTLRDDVDRFFDKVMVMVDDERIRANRLALLQTLLKEFSTIADFSEIVTEGKS